MFRYGGQQSDQHSSLDPAADLPLSRLVEALEQVKTIIDECHSEELLHELEVARLSLSNTSLSDFHDEVSPFSIVTSLKEDVAVIQSVDNIQQRNKAKITSSVSAFTEQRCPPYRHVIGLEDSFLVKDSTKPLFNPPCNPEQDRQMAKEIDELLSFNAETFGEQRQHDIPQEIAARIFPYYTQMLKGTGLNKYEVANDMKARSNNVVREFAIALGQAFGVKLKDFMSLEAESNTDSEDDGHRKSSIISEANYHYYVECKVCNLHECEKHGEYILPDADGEDESETEGDKGDSNGPSTQYDRLNMSSETVRARHEEEMSRKDFFSRIRPPSDIQPCSTTCCMLEDQHCDGYTFPGFKELTIQEESEIREFQTTLDMENSPKTYCTMASFLELPCNQIRAIILTIRPSTPRSKIPKEARRLPWYDTKKKRITKLDTWDSQTKTHLHHQRGQPKGCEHPGFACSGSFQAGQRCVCFQAGVLCDQRLCACPDDCYLRHTGCNCKDPCLWSNTCPCWIMNRECDLDLCHPFGIVHNCQNDGIQRNRGKQILVGESTNEEIGGFSGFLNEPAKKGDYLAEYVGEVITNWEREVRAKYYDAAFVNCSYIFDLNRDCAVDAWLYGNKTRFINHCHKKDQNLEAKVLLVNGEHRIGFYATRAIKEGEELLFDYGPKFTQKWKNKRAREMRATVGESRKSATTIRAATGSVLKTASRGKADYIETRQFLLPNGNTGRERGRKREAGTSRSASPRTTTKNSLKKEEQLRVQPQVLQDSDVEMMDRHDEYLKSVPPQIYSSSEEFDDHEAVEEDSDDVEENFRKPKRSKRTIKKPLKYTR